MLISPFHLVCPIRRGHLALGNVFRVARFKGFAARCFVLVSAHALLAEADRLNLVAVLRHHDVRFRRVLRRALRLVIAGYASTFEAAILLGWH